MKRQFLREHHKRQEKTWQEPSGCPGSDSGKGKPTRVWERELVCELATGTPRVYSRIRYNEQVDKEQHKDLMRKSFVQHLRSKRFLVQGYKFKFTHNLQHFAQVNDLSLEKAKVVFPEISDMANGKLEIVLRRFAKTPLEFIHELGADGTTMEKIARVCAPWAGVLQPE